MVIRAGVMTKVCTVAAVGALVLGISGPAGAATQSVEYTLDAGTVTVGSNSYVLPAATSLVGTWDDASGAFTRCSPPTWWLDAWRVTSPIAGTVS